MTGKVTEQALRELQERNEQRARELIEKMGPKWWCHPSNQVKRKDKQ